MMKLMSFLLSALLVCGLTAMGSEENAPANQVRRLPVFVTLVEEEGIAAWAGASTPLSLKAQKNTEWSDDAGLRLMIYEDGAAYLFTANEVFALRESGDRFLLELSLYRTPFDAEPCLVLPAGAVRLLRDGSMVQVQVADDPLGVLAFDGLDGMVLTKQPYTPYRYPNFNFFSGPLEPGTDWFCYFNTGDHRYAILKMAIGEDGAMTGTRRSYRRLLALVARASELGWPISVSMTITKANLREAADMFAAAALSGAAAIQVGPMMAGGRALAHPELMLSRAEWDSVKDAIRALPNAGVPFSFSDEFFCECRHDQPPAHLRKKWRDPSHTPCPAGRDFGVIGPTGQFRACLHATT